jgi:SAM-dependent MidA family methyltransferase
MALEAAAGSLPPPEAAALAHSDALGRQIREHIKSQGPLGFAEFMRMALYEPALGYYMAGLRKFGAPGDFVTAPEVSSLFSFCLAEQCLEIMQRLSQPSILEIGAGSGVMAADILQHLAHADCLPQNYFILELSAELQQRQRATLETRVPQYAGRVRWLSRLDNLELTGVILANEVLDAMPVRRFQCHAEGLQELCVDAKPSGNGFKWTLQPADELLQRAVAGIQEDIGYELPAGYTSEWNQNLWPWLESLRHNLERGVVLLIDYGYPRSEYYLPERGMGTLSCHYRHRMHDDPLILVGLQDITAFVDFSAVAANGAAAGFELGGFIDQAGFLINCGIERLCAEELKSVTGLEAQLHKTQQMKTLLLPSEMGERFKVLALYKAYNHALRGFGAVDHRHRL